MTSSLSRRAAAQVVLLGPGLALAAVAVVVANLLHRVLPIASTYGIAIVLGIIFANVPGTPEAVTPGLKFASKKFLRIGIVLLGFRLVLSDVLAVGTVGLIVVSLVAVVTFFGTQWLGKKMGLSPELSLLMATGYSICGVSAIAAVAPVSGAKPEEIGLSVGVVTLFGTLAMMTLPVLGGLIGLEGGAFGVWVGASVHDVAQVVAAASTGGDQALESAIVVKLTRVVLLAPLVAYLSVARRRSSPAEPGSARPPMVPFFVVGFLATVVLRSVGVVPVEVLPAIEMLVKLLFTTALFALGTGVNIAKLRSVCGGGILLGATAWVLVAGMSYLAVRIAGLG